MNELNNLIDLLADIYRNNIVNKGHDASGELKNFTSTYEWQGDNLMIYFNLQSYYKYLEKGTKPHFPPIEALKKWIEFKRIVPKSINGKVPSTTQLAYAIQKKIGRVGTKPTNLLKESIEQGEGIINQIVDVIYNELMKEVNKEIALYE